MAAAACLVLAAALDHWGLGRELDAVRARRADIAPALAIAMQTQDSLVALMGTVATGAALAATSPRWSGLLVDLADALPRDAHLVTLRGRGDSVVVEGMARQAAGVFQALQHMPRVARVRAEAPIRQEVASGGAVRELFTAGAVVRWP